MEYQYRSIMLEATRRCNLKCDHCLRGPAQRKDMNENILDALPTGRIGTLQITGGEPSLVKDLWRQLGWYWRCIKAQDVWVKTNAQVFHKQWALDFIEFTNRFLPHKEITSFEVSRDQYHPDTHAVCKYCKLFEEHGEQDMFHVDNKEIYDSQIIGEGRAKDWTDNKKPGILAVDDGYIEEDIYISVNGDVSIGANNSFKTSDKLSIGNILKAESLDHLITNQLKLIKRKKQIRDAISFGRSSNA